MHASVKPVGKCYGCGLNKGERCGVFENPRLMWQRHAVCPGYMNEQMLADYEASVANREAKARKEKRKLLTKLRQQEVRHVDGDRHVLIAARH